MSYASISLLRAKPYLDQVATGAEADFALETVLSAANSIVDDYLGFSFAPYGSTATDKDVRGDGSEYLKPPAYEADSITGITEVSARGETSESEDDITDYVVDEDERPYRIWRGNGWGRGTWYRVTAIWGYGSAPDSVIEVEIEIAVNIWRSSAGSNFSTSIGVEGSGAVTVGRALTWAQRSILDGIRTRYLGVVHA